ncbi:hypothetical protein QBC34DRAFT_378186 [Podospora aff. communis PSN243]|uniref:DUF4360 domain-containing protein n=1 Tax=Podospora aff. communis PSN243 TaxID=3040156 RepID=A0AAV9GSJ6_9PEZI|nr:hypothetical protein QBC34DRAFT_378186 [Podospora aff. communis PSN243]
MRFAKIVSIFILAGTALTSPLNFSITAESVTPPANEITINSASTSGSGCPRRTVAITISPDRTALTLGFDEFQTYVGRRYPASDRDKNCQIRLNLFYPGGYTFAVLDATYHGYAQLDSGVSGSLSTSYSFVGGRPDRRNGRTESTTQASLSGGGQFEMGSTYMKTDSIPVSSRVRAPCGRNATMLIRTRINLEGDGSGDAEGMMTGDDATFALTQMVRVEWEVCSE